MKGAYRSKLLGFSDCRSYVVMMWNGVMGDWEWSLSCWFVEVEGDWEESNYISYFSGEQTASAPQPVDRDKITLMKQVTYHFKLVIDWGGGEHTPKYILTIFASICRSRTRFGEDIISVAKVHERESILKSALIPYPKHICST